jgi:hypothetical protein
MVLYDSTQISFSIQAHLYEYIRMCTSRLDMNMHVYIWMSSCNLVNWKNVYPFVNVQGVDLDMVPPMKDSSTSCHTSPIVRPTTTCDYQFCVCLVVPCVLDWLALPRCHPFNPVTQRSAPTWKPQNISALLMDNSSACTLNMLKVKPSPTKCVRTFIFVFNFSARLNI